MLGGVKRLFLFSDSRLVDRHDFGVGSHRTFKNIMRNISRIRYGEAPYRTVADEYGDDEVLLRVIRLLVRPYQSELMRRLYTSNEYHLGGVGVEPLSENLWFDPRKLREPHRTDLRDIFVRNEVSGYELDISRVPILPWPWNGNRLDNALSSIGPDRHWGAWKHDPGNHVVTVVCPLRIGLVDGGNHSIATGILLGGGIIPSNAMIDLRPLYEIVHCDGRFFRLTADNRKLAKVKNPIFAAVFEIGRMIVNGR
jgi:uncharacterized protein DUF6710